MGYMVAPVPRESLTAAGLRVPFSVQVTPGVVGSADHDYSRIWLRMPISFSGLPSGPKTSTLRQNVTFASRQFVSGAICRK